MKTCLDVFNDAVHQRQKTPLCAGRYKLEESRTRMTRSLGELRRIRTFKRGRSDGWDLEQCTREDIHRWLKDLPNHIAWRLGYELLAGLDALVADGANSEAVSALRPRLQREVKRLLGDLELARGDIVNKIEREYGRMRSGTGLLEPLVERAVDLTDEVLTLLPPSVRSCA